MASSNGAMTRQHQQPWWAGPLQGMEGVLQGVQQNIQRFADGLAQRPQAVSRSTRHSSVTIASVPQTAAAVGSQTSSSSSQRYLDVTGVSSPGFSHRSNQHVTKEELGRATWVLLHTLAAQFPEHPTRQQQKDARQFIDSLTRMYPCGDCAAHFQELVRRDPPIVSSGAEFSLWMCRTHNAVNRRLGKPTFNCDLVGARWAPLDCDEHNSCDMTVGRKK